MPILLNTAYMPPVEYFAAMASEFTLPRLRRGNLVCSGKDAVAGGSAAATYREHLASLEPTPAVVILEANENYQKQSWRNRTAILSASGREFLSFPIVHTAGGHPLPIREVCVDYSTPWVLQHERAIASAYGTSAFYEYYRDELFSILEAGHPRLWDLNLALLRFFVKKTGLVVEFVESDDFLRPDGECNGGLWKGLPMAGETVDLRGAIHPKRQNDILERLSLDKPYFQVFAPRHGFVPNLSILDLLFNEGPNSISFLSAFPSF